jgi:radical SAM protein with 4Fe4S-binding SPASM domain
MGAATGVPVYSRAEQAARRRLRVVDTARVPAYVVWELTLQCDHACHHCGSRAARPRPGELTTEEALTVVAELAKLGTRELVLIGGEAYLHPGFLDVVRAAVQHGITPIMTTGGAGITPELAVAMKTAGMARVSVSVDGLAAQHDRIRAKRGSFAAATDALRNLKEASIDTAANTNINRINLADLELLYRHLRDLGILSWQVQLTVPLGRAADHPDMLLQPWMLLDLLPRLDALKTRALRDGILLMPGNNLGYFGPEEFRLRSQQLAGSDHFRGCQAGRFVMGIESDGGIKGCPSLQSASYVVGRWGAEGDVETLWNSESDALRFNEQSRKGELWGRCASCEFAKVCQAGCSFTAHAFFGRRGNNPYCHYRAIRLRREGLRERLVMKRRAPGVPFDHAQFGIVEEPFDAPVDDVPVDLIQLRRRH